MKRETPSMNPAPLRLRNISRKPHATSRKKPIWIFEFGMKRNSRKTALTDCSKWAAAVHFLHGLSVSLTEHGNRKDTWPSLEKESHSTQAEFRSSPLTRCTK